MRQRDALNNQLLSLPFFLEFLQIQASKWTPHSAIRFAPSIESVANTDSSKQHPGRNKDDIILSQFSSDGDKNASAKIGKRENFCKYIVLNRVSGIA